MLTNALISKGESVDLAEGDEFFRFFEAVGQLVDVKLIFLYL